LKPPAHTHPAKCGRVALDCDMLIVAAHSMVSEAVAD
jgi:hypothetical protein